MAKKKQIDSISFEVENLVEMDLENNLIDSKFGDALFKLLSKVEGIDEYFRLTMLQDLKRYFSAATDKERDQIRGHMSFAHYMQKKLKDSRI